MSDISILEIRTDGGTQPRSQLNWLVIDEYSDAMKDGVQFPAVTVFYDGSDYWLADGFHRVNAAQQAGLDTINADIRQGTRRDAILYSVGANAGHGLRRTNEDKRRAVLALLNDDEWRQWSDREISRRCNVHHQMVGILRSSLDDSSSERTYTTKHGTVATMNTTKIGTTPTAQIPLDVRSVVRHMPIADNPTELATLAKLDAEIQEQVIELIANGDAKKVTEAQRELTRLSKKQAPPMPSNKYRVVYADPPWQYGNSGVINDSDSYGRAERHYPTMSIDELCDMGKDIRETVEDDAVLFMWVTSPLLEECFPVIKAWGFRYKTSFVWDKVRHNFGHYNSVRHELLLVCTRGSCTPDERKLFDSVVECERTDNHSEKPEVFREMIDTLYTHGNKLELFARRDVPGWDLWGNE